MSTIDIHQEQQSTIFALLGTYRRLERHGSVADANHTLLLATRIALKWQVQERFGVESRAGARLAKRHLKCGKLAEMLCGLKGIDGPCLHLLTRFENAVLSGGNPEDHYHEAVLRLCQSLAPEVVQ